MHQQIHSDNLIFNGGTTPCIQEHGIGRTSVWIIPKVEHLEYPPGDPADQVEVTIFGEPYLIEVETHKVETHTLDNVTSSFWILRTMPQRLPPGQRY